MKEVSCRVFDVFFRDLRRRKLPYGPLVEGTGYSAAHFLRADTHEGTLMAVSVSTKLLSGANDAANRSQLAATSMETRSRLAAVVAVQRDHGSVVGPNAQTARTVMDWSFGHSPTQLQRHDPDRTAVLFDGELPPQPLVDRRELAQLGEEFAVLGA